MTTTDSQIEAIKSDHMDGIISAIETPWHERCGLLLDVVAERDATIAELRQDNSRWISARDAWLAEMGAVKNAAELHRMQAHDLNGMALQQRERLVLTEAARDQLKAENQLLRVAVEKFRSIPVEERLPTHIYTVFIYVIDEIHDNHWNVGIYNPQHKHWQAFDGQVGGDLIVKVSHWIDQPDFPLPVNQ